MRNNLRHVHVVREDGTIAFVPVSRHVLSFKKRARAAAVNSVSHTRGQFLSTVFALVLVAITFGGSPFVLGSTISFFRDDEVSRNNMFTAASLGFNLNPGDVSVAITEGETVLVSPKFTPDSGTLPITYRISAEVVGEHTPLCSQLVAVGTTSPLLYTGPLTELVTEPATAIGHGHIGVSLASVDGVAPDSSCTVAIVYRGWNADLPENKGYTDEERDTFTFVYRAEEIIEETAPETVTEGQSESMPDEAPQEAVPEPETPPSEEVPVVPPSDESAPEPVVENFSPSGGTPADAPPEEVQETPVSEPPAEETAPQDIAPEPIPEPPSESPPVLSTESPPIPE